MIRNATVGRKTGVIVLFLALIIALLCAGACLRKHTDDMQASFEKIKSISLSDAEKVHVLQLARAVAFNKPKPDRSSAVDDVYAQDPRGAFVTVFRPHKRAESEFAFGPSLAVAVEEAAGSLQLRLDHENVSTGRVRVDVVKSVSESVKQSLSKSWKSQDLSNSGVFFPTNPPAVFMPMELRNYGVISNKNEFSKTRLKTLLKARKFDKSVVAQFADASEMQIIRFKTISFVEDGDKIDDLYRGNLLDGFDATPQRLEQAIDAAGRYLTDAVMSDGKFQYLYNPARDTYSHDYNYLRHAGTAFSMGQIYSISHDPNLLAALQRSLKYLAQIALPPDPETPVNVDFRAITDPKGHYAKLGGSGLALLAYGTYTQITGDRQYVPLMQQLGRFIQFQQDANGDMRHYYYWKSCSEKNRKREPVLFYPGESFYGLATLYEIDKDPQWMNVVEKGIDYIADVRDGAKPTKSLEHDHWLMYAVNEMDKVKPRDNQFKHAYRVTEAMLQHFNDKSKYPDFVGGYYSRPKTTPTACRLEATTAVYELAMRHNDKAMADRLYQVLLKGATFLMRNQYNEINSMFFAKPDKAIGGYQGHFWDPEIEIDYVQHSTSALFNTRRIMLERAQAGGNVIPMPPAKPNVQKPAVGQ